MQGSHWDSWFCMLALSFKAYSVPSARLLLYMTAKAFVFLHSLCSPHFIFTSGFLRLHLVFPDRHKVSVSSTRLVSAYTLLFFISPCISPISYVCCLLLLVKVYSLMCFCCIGLLESCFSGLRSPFLCLTHLFSSSWFSAVQTFLVFCQILMAEFDTGFSFWGFSRSLFLASTG